MTRSAGPSRGDRVDAWLDALALDDGEGPALPLAGDAALDLVRRAREQCAPAPRATLSRLPKWPLIGIGVVVASSAAAAAFGELPTWLGWSVPSEAPAPSHAPTPGAPSTRPARTAVPAADVASAAVASAAVASSAVASADVPAPAAPPPPADTPGPATSTSKRTTPSRERDIDAPDAKRAPAPDSPRAADLLAVANRARAERRYADALASYREVITSYAPTRQAQIAAVAAGELELERGNARAAQPLFQRVPYDAEVGAEALFGLAEAYRGEGRVVEERGALERFVRLYPSNPLTTVARSRLARQRAAAVDPIGNEPAVNARPSSAARAPR